MGRTLAILLGTTLALAVPEARAERRPPDIVDLRAVDPTIAVDAMYFTPVNFVGRPIRGYRANACLLTKAAATALRAAQSRLRATRPELTLVVRDCYRPRKSVAHFLEWARRPDQLEMKAMFYPDLTKAEILERGYIAPVSGHSRASTVDLAIGRRTPSGALELIAMGTRVDFFGERSHTDHPGITAEERANRRLLLSAMTPEFRNFAKEWWHFSLDREPYPNTSFDFDVE